MIHYMVSHQPCSFKGRERAGSPGFSFNPEPVELESYRGVIHPEELGTIGKRVKELGVELMRVPVVQRYYKESPAVGDVIIVEEGRYGVEFALDKDKLLVVKLPETSMGPERSFPTPREST